MSEMKTKLLLVPICATLLVGFILFVPVVATSSYTGCGPNGCVGVVQYVSISYQYGGWGALFQTGVNWYAVDGWVCSCPSETPGHYIPCCIPPYPGVVWGAVTALFLTLLLSLVFISRRRPLVEPGMSPGKIHKLRTDY